MELHHGCRSPCHTRGGGGGRIRGWDVGPRHGVGVQATATVASNNVPHTHIVGSGGAERTEAVL
jgi:hypothetical protein